ncbi:MAG: DUF222 domain-containing protein [Ilumatobacteraceae bacterium]
MSTRPTPAATSAPHGDGQSVAAMVSGSNRRVATVLDGLEAALADIESLDLSLLSRQALAQLVVRLQRFADRQAACQARVMGEADRAGVWSSGGSRSMAGWLADQTNGSYGRAVEMMRLADAFDAAPRLASQVQTGAISAATAVTLHSAIVSPPAGADAAAVESLLDACTGVSPRDAKTVVEQWKAEHAPLTPQDVAERAFAQRSVRFSQPHDGLVTTTAVLPTDDADQLRKLLGALGEAPTADNGLTTEQSAADGLLALIALGQRTDTTAGRGGATLLVTIDIESFSGATDTPGVTEFGNPVPAHVVRRLADNAVIHRVVTAGSVVLDVGRGRRLATDAQFTALVARDGGCRVHGCHTPAAWCEVDHIRAWEDGGATDLGNLWLLCGHHHRLKHRPGVQVIGSGHSLSLLTPDGTTLSCAPRPRRRTQAAA